MHPIDQLGDELSALRVARTVDPQDERRIQRLVAEVESECPIDNIPDEWYDFTSQLESVLNGVRDAGQTNELYSKYKTAVEALPTNHEV